MAKRLLLLTSIILLFTCMVLAVWVKSHMALLWPVKVVKVAGVYQNVGQSDLQKIMQPYVSNSFLFVDTKNLQQQLLQSPWIAAASVKRIWPNTVVVGVIEQQAVARWNDKSLMNAEGDIFTPESALPNNIPWLHGPEGQAKLMLQEYQRLNIIVQPLQLTVKEIDLSSRHAWNIVLSNGTTIILGHTDIEARLARFVHVYDRLFKDHPAVSVDTRYHNGLAVQWQTNVG